MPAINDKFTVMEHAAYRYVWMLPANYVSGLHKHFIMRATGAQLYAAVQEDHEYFDHLVCSGDKYTVCWSACSMETLRKNPTANFLLSFRLNATNSMYIVLIRKAYADNERSSDITKYKEYNNDGN